MLGECGAPGVISEGTYSAILTELRFLSNYMKAVLKDVE